MSGLSGMLRRRWAMLVPPLCIVIALGATLTVMRARSGASAPAPQDTVIARVGPDSIPRSLLDARMEVATTALTQSGHTAQPGTKEYTALRASVIKSLIFDTLIAQQARARHVAPSQAEIDAEVAADVSAAGGDAQLRSQLAQAGGSLTQLRDETRSRLDEADLEDAWARDRADDILHRLAAGQRLDDVAARLSDDQQSNQHAGNLGSVSLDQLRAGDADFAAGVARLAVGETTTQPIRDAAGYEIVRLDGRTATTLSLHRVLVAAPRPYTVKERPPWFTQAVLQALLEDCGAGRISVVIDASVSPCGLSTASPSASSSRAPSPTPSATPSGSGGNGFVPRPAPGSTSPSPSPSP